MALVDVLSFVFDADATKLKKGAGEAETTIEETKNTVIDTDKAAEDLGKTFLDTIGQAKGAIAGILSLGAITASVVAQAAATDELGKFSQRLGLNIEEVGSWSEAVARSGGSADTFRNSVETLSDNLTELAQTGGGPAAEAFARLGVSATDAEGNMKGVFDLLPELADSFQGLSEAQSVELGKKLGLDQATILLLQQGRGEVDALVERQKALGVATEKDAEIAAAFNDAMDDLQQVFGSLSREVGAYLLPAFTAILGGVEGIVTFLRDNKQLVVGFFIAVAGIITTVYLPAMLKAAAVTIAANLPFIALVAVATAVAAVFALLYDDFQSFISGGESVIGLIQGKILTAFEDFKKSILDTWETFKGFFSFFNRGSDMTVEATKKAEIAITESQKNPLSGRSARSIRDARRSVNRQTTVSVGAVNVDARGGDAEEISAGISTALNDQMQQAVSNADDGIDY